MKNLLLYGPILWFRKIIIFLLVLLVLFAFILYFVANSPLAIKKAADIFAKDYNISYDAIEGNALTGIEIQHPRFKNEALAKSITLKWNPNTLANKVISVQKLHIEKANVEVIKTLIASFSAEENEKQVSKEESNSSFDFKVDTKDIDISLEPFVQSNILVNKATLTSDKIVYTKDTFSVDNVLFALDTNITNILLKGSMKEQEAKLSLVQLKDVNLSAILPLFASDENNTKEEKRNTPSTEESPNIFIPKVVKIDQISTNILAFEYEPIKVKEIVLDAKNVIFDEENLILKDADIELNTTANLSDLHYKGNAHNNHLLGNINLTPHSKLYEKYSIPLRKEAISNITIDFDASKEDIIADVKTKGKQILKAKKGSFNVDVDSFISHLKYDINTSHLKADTKALVHTPYAKNIRLKNTFILDKTIHYTGEAEVKRVIGIDSKFTKPLENLHITYRGTKNSLDAELMTDAFQSTFKTDDFNTGNVHLKSRKPLVLSTLFTLPKELQEAKATLDAEVPLDFKNLSNIHSKVKLQSNVVNIDANVAYAKEIVVKAKVEIPKKSLVRAYSSDVKWDALSPIDTSIKLGKEKVKLKLKAKVLQANVDYMLKQGTLKGKVDVAGLVANISGNTQKILKVNTKISSIKALSKKLSSIYKIDELPPLEGKINASLLIDKLKKAEVVLVAPKLMYRPDKKTKHKIEDVKFVVGMDASKIVLKSYRATFNKQKYFSNKVATVTLGDTLKVDNFWINDELKVTGHYSIKTKQGTFSADAVRFHIKDKHANIETEIHLNTHLDGDDTSITGKIIILKGKIIPATQQGKTFASDSDIIILQRQKNKQKSPFMRNLSLVIKVESKVPLIINKKPMNLRLKPDFNINKEKGGELLYFGDVQIIKGSSYSFEEKRFVLQKSFIYFTGDVNKPVLDIKANYKSLDYLIKIMVTGTPATPNVDFTSSPSLTREQILSVILFDSDAAGDTQSGNNMMKMMGGAMAKAALSDVGVKVDHLVFGEGNSIEVGKKLSSKMTVIYINGDMPKVKLKYKHNTHMESEIGASEESQSVDIVYKKDF